MTSRYISAVPPLRALLTLLLILGAPADIFLKEDQLYLRAYGFEQPITKVSADSFSVTVPGYRGPWRFKLLPVADGKAEYLCLSLGVMKRARDK